MAANVLTGRTRAVRYCGADYTVRPSSHPDAVTGKKQVWEILCGGEVIKPWVISLSRCVYYIHEHAMQSGRAGLLSDGGSYQALVNQVCR